MELIKTNKVLGCIVFAPCPFCGREMKLRTHHDEVFGDTHVLTHADDAQILCVLYRGLIWNGSVKDFAELWNRREKYG